VLLDANLLLSATNRGDPRHRRAAAWLENALNEEPRVGIPWVSLLAFVRISTNARLLKPPLRVEVAWGQVEDWLDVETVWIPEPGGLHRKLLGRLIRQVSPTANMIPDAHLAALALEHGLTLYSFDADFAAFPGLRWKNPLLAPDEDD
jgi:toxin-antitoxin system PIN domain toxin